LHHILTVDYYNKTFVMTRTQIEKDWYDYHIKREWDS
jgi:hypothetical protein